MVGNGKLAPLFLLRRVGGPVPELFARGEAFSVLDIFQSCAASQIKNEIENWRGLKVCNREIESDDQDFDPHFRCWMEDGVRSADIRSRRMVQGSRVIYKSFIITITDSFCFDEKMNLCLRGSCGLCLLGVWGIDRFGLLLARDHWQFCASILVAFISNFRRLLLSRHIFFSAYGLSSCVDAIFKTADPLKNWFWFRRTIERCEELL